VLLAEAGHRVKFVSLTDGSAGHHEMKGAALVQKRRAEAEEAASRLGIDAYEGLDYTDGELMPTLEVRRDVIRLIREWQADVVVGPRPNDYHPDHRYAGRVIQDAAYQVQVPNTMPEVEPTDGNPVFLYFEDQFQRPRPFRPDVSVIVDEVLDRKIDALDAHESQFYGWLPWTEGTIDEIPEEETARKAWLKERWMRPVSAEERERLGRWYPADRARQAQYVESFQLTEYGHQASEEEIARLFSVFPDGSRRQ
jgi:LmbE family N-acetylglucosaminyl deacetylase